MHTWLDTYSNCGMTFLFVFYSVLRFLSQILEILSSQEKMYQVPARSWAAVISASVFREITQKDDRKTQDGRMTKKCGARQCLPNLTRHFFVILPFWMFQPSCCLSSLLLSVLRYSTNGRFCNHERLLFLIFFWDILRVCLYLPSMASILYLEPFALFSVLLSRQKFSKSGSLRCQGLVYSFLFQLSLPTLHANFLFDFLCK